MKMRGAFALLAVGASLTACKKKEPADETGAGTGTATGTAAGTSAGTAAAPPPATRPSQGKLEPMPALELPADDKRDAKIALGHALYFDKRLSVDGSRACYSCHMNEDGLGGHDPIAIGPGDKKLTRHSPVLWNIGPYPAIAPISPAFFSRLSLPTPMLPPPHAPLALASRVGARPSQ